MASHVRLSSRCLRFEQNDNVTSMSVGPEGRSILVNLSSSVRPAEPRSHSLTGQDAEILLWDLDSLEIKQRYKGHKQDR